MLTMNPFKGCIEELENVLVDNFVQYDSFTCYFLSHCHADHMEGLPELLSDLEKRKEGEHFLYCSPTSRLILLNKYYASYADVIIPIHSTRIVTVPKNDKSPEYKITVTSIPAQHCPGSIMFLFEVANKAILYTGDFRVAVGDIQKLKMLYRDGQVLPIHKLYFDSTFLSESYWNFPPRSEVIEEIKFVVENWLNRKSNNHVLLITSAQFGYEDVFTELAKALKCKVHVKDLVYDIFYNVPEIGCALTKDSKATRIHAGMYLKDFNEFLNKNAKNLLKIKLSAQWYKSPKESSVPTWKKVSKRSYKVCYSNHCSCSELVYFLNQLQPTELVPCSSTRGCSSNERNHYIQRLIWSWPLKCDKERQSIETITLL